MAVATVVHKPNLTKEQAQEVFRRHFGGRYKVEDWKGPSVGAPRDFAVIRNAFVGVAVKLQQGAGETKFVYTGFAPKLWARVLFSGLASYLFWNSLTNEVKELIETATEFN